jgi:hypothetical protein
MIFINRRDNNIKEANLHLPLSHQVSYALSNYIAFCS